MKFNFEENRTVDSLAGVPQDFHGLYKEGEDGKFSIDADNPVAGSAVKAVIGLNNALESARADVKRLQSGQIDLSPLADYGETVADIATSFQSKVDELTAQVAKGKDAKINIDKIKEDIAASFAAQTKEKDVKIEALTGQLYGLMVDSAAKSAVADAKGDINLLMPFIKQQVKAVEEDGAFKIYVVDKDNERRFSAVTGSAMTIKELVDEMKGNEQYGKLFDSEAPRGPGMGPGKRHGAPQPKGEEKNATAKISSGLNSPKYRQAGSRA